MKLKTAKFDPDSDAATASTEAPSGFTMSAPRRLSVAADYAELLDRYDTWLFDCDGVLWRGNTLIDGVLEVLDLLRSRGAY